MIVLTTIDWVGLVTTCAVLLLGTVGNLLVVYVFGCRKRNRSNYQTLLLTLGVVDFFGAIFSPSLLIYEILTEYKEWHFGTFGCKVIPTILKVNVTLSQGILILISFERYQGIVNPFRAETLTRRRLGIYLLAIVMFAFIMLSPSIHALELKDGHSCFPRPGNTMLAQSAIVVAVQISVLLILTFSNTRISKAIHSSFQVLSLDREKSRRLVSYKRSQKIIAVMVASFSIFVMPADLMNLGVSICHSVDASIITASTWKIIHQCNTVLLSLQMASTYINVMIYTGMDPEFKLVVKSIVCSCNGHGRVMSIDGKQECIQLEPITVTQSICT